MKLIVLKHVPGMRKCRVILNLQLSPQSVKSLSMRAIVSKLGSLKTPTVKSFFVSVQVVEQSPHYRKVEGSSPVWVKVEKVSIELN